MVALIRWMHLLLGRKFPRGMGTFTLQKGNFFYDRRPFWECYIPGWYDSAAKWKYVFQYLMKVKWIIFPVLPQAIFAFWDTLHKDWEIFDKFPSSETFLLLYRFRQYLLYLRKIVKNQFYEIDDFHTVNSSLWEQDPVLRKNAKKDTHLHWERWRASGLKDGNQQANPRVF